MTFRAPRITGGGILVIVVAFLTATSISIAETAPDSAVSCENLKNLFGLQYSCNQH